MALPKKLSTGVRYLSSSAYNCYVDFLNPNSGALPDGTPNAPTVVAAGVHANVSPWRSKEIDKAQIRIGQSSFKVVIRFPKTFAVDTGMLIQQTRGGATLLMNIDSAYDPDGQNVELHIYAWTQDAVLGVTP
jgi:hypothetical protein